MIAFFLTKNISALKFKRFYLFFLIPFSFSCNQNKKISNQEAKALPADFIPFYERFHADSTYQMAHIKFPLDGMPSQADSTMVGLYHYTPENWTFQTLKGFNDTTFIRKFESPIPELVNESIIQRGVGFGTYRRFYKRSGEWMLIYYSDVNRISDK